MTDTDALRTQIIADAVSAEAVREHPDNKKAQLNYLVNRIMRMYLRGDLDW